MERSAEGHSPTSTQLSSVHAAMDAALAAARLGVRGANPLVGAAVLASDGTIVTGHHRGAGTPHAEPAALAAARSAGIDLTTSIVCVTLEPCTHHGRTGPCADLLIDAGVPEVVVAVADPHPPAAGGCARLREAGVTVRTGVREAEARALNARWLRAVGERRPYVTLKMAQSLDGRIAAADGTSQWITSPASRERVHILRARVDAVVVGTGTAHADDPRLTARPAAEAPGTDTDPVTQPLPVVLGMRDLAPGSHLARDPRTVHLRTRDPLAALQALRERGLEHVLVEGGAHIAGAFLRAGVVDELELHIAPLLLGDGLPGLADLGVTTLAEAIRWVPDDTAAGISPDSATSNPDTILRLRPADSLVETPSTTAPRPARTPEPAPTPGPVPTPGPLPTPETTPTPESTKGR